MIRNVIITFAGARWTLLAAALTSMIGLPAAASAGTFGGTAQVRAWDRAPALAAPVRLDTKPDADAKRISPRSAVFRYLGADARRMPGTWGRNVFQPHGVSGPIDSASAWSVATTSRGRKVTFRFMGGHHYAARIRVDGHASRAFSLPGKWQSYSLTVRFSHRRARQVQLELTGAGMSFFGVERSRRTRLAPSRLAAGPRTIVLGDSWTAAYPVRRPIDGYVQVMGRVLGLADIWASGVGGTGYVHAGSFKPFGQRLKSDVLRFKPVTVIVAGGANDLRASEPDFDAAARKLFARIRAGLPRVRLVAVGAWVPSGSVWPGLLQRQQTIKAAVEAYGGQFVDTTGWITGRGSTLAPSGDGGNASVLIGEKSHPNQAGYDYIGRRLAAALKALPTPTGR